MSDQPKLGEWQPIETRPKEEKQILVYWPEIAFVTAPGVAVVWSDDLSLVHCGDFATSSRLDGEPTHWMPIPPLPY